MRKLHAHQLVVETAKEMAAALYEECAKNNEWYRLNPCQNTFVVANHGSLIEQARQILAMTLKNGNISEAQKEEIFNALLLDRTLQHGRGVRYAIAQH